MVTSDSSDSNQSSKWPRLAAIAGIIAAAAGLLGNLDKIGKFTESWILPAKPSAPTTVIVQITTESLLEAASRAAAVASAASGMQRAEALQAETELRKAAKDPRAQLAAMPASSVPKWLSIAFAEIGQSELPDQQDNPRIVEYLRATTLPDTMLHDDKPWTSAFANWALNQSGIKGSGTANPNDWLKWGQQIQHPKLGALVLLKRPVSPALAACFFVSETPDSVVCVGGNFSNSVSILAAKKESVHSYRWPSNT